MATQILGSSSTSVSLMNRWLKKRGCPEYAELYKKYGDNYGVRWDLAVFQSCLETGFWKFGGAVRPSQNNFAGIGSTSSTVPGDSFESPAQGIAAQIQNLALRSGVFIEKEKVISPYVKANYELIKNRGTKTWESLSGTYAADKQYHEKIFAIREDFNAFSMEEQPVAKVATWIGFGIDGEKGLFVQALAGGEGSVETMYGNDNAKLIEFLQKYVGTAKTRQILQGGPVKPASDEPLPPPPPPPVIKSDWIPFAKKVALFKTKKYPKAWPEGLVVHFTAGGDDAMGTCDYLRSKGFPCLVLAKNGDVLQGFPASEGGAHSGTEHHNRMVGVEIVCGGKLTPLGDGSGKTWFDKVIPAANCRSFKAPSAPAPQVSGLYEKYTDIQEKILIKLCLWYKEQAPETFSFDNVLGHDECTQLAGQGARKNDPSGSLSMTMPKFRDTLKALWEAGKRSKDY